MTIKPIPPLGNLDDSRFSLPLLQGFAAELSRSLQDRIFARIKAEGSLLSFAAFMQMALYEPGLGYYVAGRTKFGEAGDFVTAPELSGLFADLLAEQCAEVLRGLGAGAGILEFGGGSGRMAVGILAGLDQRQCLPVQYWILELSPDLRERQKAEILRQIPHLLERVKWLDTLEGFSMSGVILANEVLDAMPVQRFSRTHDGVDELAVCVLENRLHWSTMAAKVDLIDAVREIEAARGVRLPAGYVSEVNLNIAPWFNALSECLSQGVVLCIDYGYSRREYYLDDRSQGTLMCHYRHRAHTDPLVLVGAQDITAYVDFTAVAEAACRAGLTLSGYTTQAYFLLGCGADRALQRLQTELSEVEFLRLTQQMKTLLFPSEMGERFKVIALSCKFDEVLQGFALMDFSNRL